MPPPSVEMKQMETKNVALIIALVALVALIILYFVHFFVPHDQTKGPIGADGPVGPEGQQGPQGETGLVGPAGLQGAGGPKGATGERGPQGSLGHLTSGPSIETQYDIDGVYSGNIKCYRVERLVYVQFINCQASYDSVDSVLVGTQYELPEEFESNSLAEATILTSPNGINIGNFQNRSNLGNWNASTNEPTILSSIGDAGQFYFVSVPGSTDIDGTDEWNVGDWIMFDGSVWKKSYAGQVIVRKWGRSIYLIGDPLIRVYGFYMYI